MWGSLLGDLRLLRPLGIELSDRLALELDAMGGVHDTVADGVGNRGFSEDFMIPPYAKA